MILTITMNPAIDCRYSLDKLEIDAVTRCDDYGKTAGGKGINVARILKALGKEVITTGFIGGKIGEYFLELLEKDNVKNNFIKVEGNTRLCLALLGRDGSQTEVLEAGPEITSENQAEFMENFNKLISKAELICISGSLGKGMENVFYRELCEIAAEKNIPVILDTSGKALVEGIKGKPCLIKPNIDELSAIYGKTLKDRDEVIAISREMIKEGVRYLAVSMGKEGALLISENKVLLGKPPLVEVKNPVGSGDSMVGGFAKAISEGLSMEEILKWGIACGTANAMDIRTGYIDKEVAKDIYNKVNIEVIE